MRFRSRTFFIFSLLAIFIILLSAWSVIADTAGPNLVFTPANGAQLLTGTTISVEFSDTDTLNDSSVVLTVNGENHPVTVNFTPIWDSCGEFILGYDYTSGSFVDNLSINSAGTYHVVLTAEDQLGNSSTIDWEFTITAKPLIMDGYTPTNNQRIANLNPEIRIPVKQDIATDGNLFATMKLNGIDAIPTVVKQNDKRWDVVYQAIYLTNDVEVTVTGTVYNSDNQSSSYSFAFMPTITPPTVTPNVTEGTQYTAISSNQENYAIVNLFDIDNINGSSVTMTVNGQAYATSVTFPDIPDPNDTCTTIPDYTRAAVTGPQLKNGSYTVTVSGRDGLGNQVNTTYSYSLAVPPRVTSFTPPPNQAVASLNPFIKFMVNDLMGYGIDPARTRLTVGGQLTPSNIAGDNTFISRNLTGLQNETMYPVSLIVYDYDGTNSTYNTTLYTNTYGEMPVQAPNGCAPCHNLNAPLMKYAHTRNAHDWGSGGYDGDTCNMCHSGGWTGSYYCNYCHQDTDGAGHEWWPAAWINPPTLGDFGAGSSCLNCHAPNVAPEAGTAMISNSYPYGTQPLATYKHEIFPAHITSYTAVAGGGEQCLDCHSKNLTRTHIRTGINWKNFSLNCGTCHMSADARIITAVQTTKDTNCSACHDDVSSTIHRPKHEETKERGACYGCHNNYIDDEHMANTLDAVMMNASTPLLPLIKCTDCHEYSGSKPAAAAISNHDTDCAACHNTIHSDQSEKHETIPTFIPEAPVTCAACHSENLINLHDTESINCETCHLQQSLRIDSTTIHNTIFNEITACNSCHGGFGDSGAYHNDLDAKHTATRTSDIRVDCSICHNMVISDEHIGGAITSFKGNLYNCDSCHVPNSLVLDNALVNAAVYAGHTIAATDPQYDYRNDCAKCHTVVHARETERHDTDFAAAPNLAKEYCSICHSSSLVGEHDGRQLSPGAGGGTMSCNTCHTAGGQVRLTINTGIFDPLKDINLNINNSCDKCHADVDDIHVSYPTAHTTTDTFIAGADVTCTGCHGSADLRNIHTGAQLAVLKLIKDVDCGTCHTSEMTTPSEKTVKNLIVDSVRNGTTDEKFNCDACHSSGEIHPSATVSGRHTSVFETSPQVDCISCHDTGNMEDIHVGKTIELGLVMTCDTCHNNGSAAIKAAIIDNVNDGAENTLCISCHFAAMAYHTDLDVKHTTAYAPVPGDVNCFTCHSQRLDTEHLGRIDQEGTTLDCNTCHTSLNPNIRNAISNHQTDCTVCHTAANNMAYHVDKLTKHDSTFTEPEKSCDACHMSNLVDEHIPADPFTAFFDSRPTAFNGYTCNTCHEILDDNQVGDAVNVRSTIQNHLAEEAPRAECADCHVIHADLNIPHTSTYVADAEVNCTNCHEEYIQIEHEGRVLDDGSPADCRTCHKSGNPLVLNAVNLGQTNCDSCHGNFRSGFHNDVDSKHGGILPIFSPQVTCTGCHDSDLAAEHSKITVIGQQGCNTCHASGKPAILDSVTGKDKNCADCHTAGNDMAYHIDLSAPHNSTYHEDPPVNCSKCHNYDLTEEHVGRINDGGEEITCDSCHASGNLLVGLAIENGVTDCTGCHNVHPDEELDTLHNSDYTGDPDDQCMGCHQPSINRVHTGLTRDYRPLDCNTCHESADLNVAGAVTTGLKKCTDCHETLHDVTAIHQSNYTDPLPFSCSACHLSELTAEHGSRELDCSACHESVDIRVTDAIAAQSTDCNSCHDIHEDIGSSHGSTYMASPSVNCGGCHENNLADEHTSRSIDGQEMECGTCHSSEDAVVQASITAREADTYCSDCHSSIHPDVTADHTGNFAETPAFDCTPCHDGNLKTEHEDRGLNCNTCHASASLSVKSTIAAGLKTCDACHDIHQDVATEHQSSYSGGLGVACFTCHSRVLSTEHDNQGYDCSTCHNSTNSVIIDAIENARKNCDACHTSIHSNLDAPHTTDYRGDLGVDCYKCHNDNLMDEHEDRQISCNSCHKSTEQEVRKAIFGGDTDCSACHVIHEELNQPHTFVNQGKLAVNCFNCHNNNAILEHGEKNKDCNICHDSSFAAVTQGADERKTGCDSCHTTVHKDYEPKHIVNTFTGNDKFNCGGCHQANLTAEHANNGLNCDNCHDSDNSRVNTAIAAGQVECVKCHEEHKSPEQAHQLMYKSEDDLRREQGLRYQQYSPERQAEMKLVQEKVSCLRCHGIH